MKQIILAALTLFSVSLFTPLIAQPAYAACPGENANSPKEQVLQGTGTAGGNCSGSGVTRFINTIVDIISIIVGIAAVIMIIISGFKYITSSGDSGKIASAKTTLIYALVGVAIVALAQFLVNFMLSVSSGSVR